MNFKFNFGYELPSVPVPSCCCGWFARDARGWMICLAVLIITVIRSGITYSFGIFVVKLEDTYHKPLAEQNWIGTLSFAISLSFSPLSVMLIRYLGPNGYRITGIAGTLCLSISCLGSSFIHSQEWLFLTHSLLYGVGSSLIYMSSSLIIGDYFDKSHNLHVLATSILLCGYPVGSLLFNPLNAWILESYGWRVAFRASSGLILVIGLACCTLFKPKSKPGYTEEKLDDENPSIEEEKIEEKKNSFSLKPWSSLKEVRRRPEIVLWLVGNFLSYLGFYMPFLNLAFYMDKRGIDTVQSAWALTLLSLVECITYVISSIIGDFFKGRLVFVNLFASVALCIICFMWPFVDVGYDAILALSSVMGAFLGLTIVYTYAASGEVTQLPIDVAWSHTNMWCGFGILLGPLFSGTIYDIRQSYDDVFYVIGTLYLLGTVIFGTIILIGRLRDKNKLEYEEFNDEPVTNYKDTFRVTKRSISTGNMDSDDDSSRCSSSDNKPIRYSENTPIGQP
ncbi:unnamed protein product [Owenia fusiformis]|uniref:Major facilitator superfamily (MFS) profile domain-containing protein n=1 Tax=Owenia fusiformis TaxID=6347 RepID=A0A8S4N2M4_OWEFU|nr:unnamed protein product [Owenia fusiformis]